MLLIFLDTCNLIVDLVMFSLEFLHLLDLILDQPVNLVPGQAQRIHSLKIHRTKAELRSLVPDEAPPEYEGDEIIEIEESEGDFQVKSEPEDADLLVVVELPRGFAFAAEEPQDGNYS